MSSRNCYVYEYVRLDTNEPFYVGKGSGNRWKELKASRSNYFKNIIKNIPVAVVILKDNLTSDEALNVESWYIWKLRDRLGYNLINFTDGGEGENWSDNKTKKEMEEFRKNQSLNSTQSNKENRLQMKQSITEKWKDETYKQKQLEKRKSKEFHQKRLKTIKEKYGDNIKSNQKKMSLISIETNERFDFDSLKDAAKFLGIVTRVYTLKNDEIYKGYKIIK